jgi:hypothetical protein
MKGLRPIESFQARTAYGNMWHTCEEALAGKKPWLPALKGFCNQLIKEHPASGLDIDWWYRVCKVQFPLYIEHWKKHPEVVNRKPLAQEQVFDFSVTLPSGRIVRLRGKMDSVDLINAAVWLQENKTRASVDEEETEQQMHCDLQSMMYLIVCRWLYPDWPIGGVRYNVVRRPLSGGRHTIRPHKATKKKPAETRDAFFKRLEERMREDTEYFFMRHTVPVPKLELEQFDREVLTPLLESLCDWWEWVIQDWHHPFRKGNKVHWRFPYGVWNSTLEGYSTEVDKFLNTGSMVGLVKTPDLFGELKP